MRDEQIPRGAAVFGDDTVQIHFDGACEPPRRGGVATFGFTVEGGGFTHEECGLATRPRSEHATNNVAEYVAAIRALEWLAEQGFHGAVVLSGDSELVIRQVTGVYAVKKAHLKAYHDRLFQLAERFQHVEFRWVPREQNTRADALSKQARTASSARPRASRAPARVRVADEDPGPGGFPTG